MDKKIYRLLIRSLDDKLSDKKQRRLNNYLSALPELQKERKIFLKIRKSMKEQEYKLFPFFAEKVMNKIIQLKKKQKEYINFANLFLLTFKRVSFSGFAIFLMLLAGFYLSEGSLSINLFNESFDFTYFYLPGF
ncbi:MAG: hypothetical protein K8R86_02595 [Bacteroidales bacterium]|nr:hypothetical protein [Bacteroidales bacterium]